MTKLYHGPDGKGWQVPGQQDKKAARVDVPSSPDALATWLNERECPISPEALTPFDDMSEEAIANLRVTRLELDDHAGDAAAYLRGPIAGAVITEAEVAKVNASRPDFLPRLDAAEIERHRMAMNRCPKCNSVAELELRLSQITAWLRTASAEDLEHVAAVAKEEAAELLGVASGQGRTN